MTAVKIGKVLRAINPRGKELPLRCPGLCQAPRLCPITDGLRTTAGMVPSYPPFTMELESVDKENL